MKEAKNVKLFVRKTRLGVARLGQSQRVILGQQTARVGMLGRGLSSSVIG